MMSLSEYIDLQTSAYRKVITARRKGLLKSEPCERCGEVKTDAHHEDYKEPLRITWLCRKCHKQRHTELSKAGWGWIKRNKNTVI